MFSAPAQRVSVWLDELAPGGGAFAHAVEWACQFGWPLRLLAVPGSGQTGDRRQDDRLHACEAACQQRGVDGEVAGSQPGAGDGLGRDDLYVLGDARLPAPRAELLRQALCLPGAGVLLCPRDWQPVSRVLVLVQGRDPASAFLHDAADICRLLGAEPVVLTLAGSESEARRREQFAEDRFARHLLTAEFDSVVGGELRETVPWVARLRRCSLVLVEREAPSWWRWLRGETVERLTDLAKKTSVLALPGT